MPTNVTNSTIYPMQLSEPFRVVIFSWYSMLEKTCWLNYIGQLIKSAFDIACALELDGRPVMVHCTDGWDRTTQLSSLAQLLADPYYRTVEVIWFYLLSEGNKSPTLRSSQTIYFVSISRI